MTLEHVDERLSGLCVTIAQHETEGPLSTEQVYAYVRAAYGQGYTDALAESQPDLAAARMVQAETWARLPVL